VVHAYSDGRSGDVTVEAWREGASHLVVLVSDEGCGMTRNAGSRGMGFGLVLMTQLASGFVISSRDGKPGTVVSLRFALA
jgi:two-component sensor histidine kinase